MNFDDVALHYESDLKHVEERIEEELQSQVRLIPQISHYIIQSGGKRFRPLLLVICADLFGYDGPDKYDVAAVLEFIHTSSLLHDDVLDHATIRRGMATANKIWGNYASVLAGDFTFSKAFRMLIAVENLPLQELLTSATIIMIEGEVTQFLQTSITTISEDEYFTAIERKTGALIAASCGAAALLAHAPTSSVDRLRSFGMKLGLAFQITDDVLDYCAAETELGKQIGTDVRERKMTLPLIYGLSNCSIQERQLIEGIINKEFLSDDDVSRIISFVRVNGGIDYARGEARRLIAEATADIDTFPNSFARESLRLIADYVTSRHC